MSARNDAAAHDAQPLGHDPSTAWREFRANVGNGISEGGTCFHCITTGTSSFLRDNNRARGRGSTSGLRFHSRLQRLSDLSHKNVRLVSVNDDQAIQLVSA